MTRRGCAFRGCGIGCIVVVLLLVGGIASLVIISGNKLRSEMSALQAKGHILTVDDLANDKVPDSENAAVVYDGVIKLLESPSLRPDLRKLDDLGSPEERLKNPGLWKDARQILRRNKQIPELIAQAQQRSRCRFPVNWKAGPAALFPHYMPMREAARFLRASALVNARYGNMDEAVRSVEMGFKLSESLGQDPILIGQLVSFSTLAIASQSLRDVGRYGKINEAQAKHLYDVLGKIDLYPDYVRAMEGERAMGLAAFDMARKDPRGAASLAGGSGSSSSGALAKAMGLAYGAIAPLDKAAYMRFMDRYIKAAAYPYREAMAKHLFPTESELPRYALVSRIVCPVFSRAGIARDVGTAEIIGSQTYLALQVYKRRYGSYPADLGELREKIGWKLRKDPLTGKDLIYKRKGKDFILYSVGRNLTDDGGKGRMSSGGSGDDIVWKSKPDPVVLPPKLPPTGPPMPPPPGPAPSVL